MLVVPAHPLLLSAFVLADSASPHGSAYRISGGYVVPEASDRAVTGSACPGRERLMEQPVSSSHNSSCETETHATCRSHKDVIGKIDSDGDDRHGLPLLLVLMKVETSSWHVDADSRLPPQPQDGEVPFIRQSPSTKQLRLGDKLESIIESKADLTLCDCRQRPETSSLH
jgi:hypothetical protein